MYLWRQPSVNAKKLAVHHGRQRQGIERVDTGLVHVVIVLSRALSEEGEVLGQLPALMVAPDKVHALRVRQLERPQVQHTL